MFKCLFEKNVRYWVKIKLTIAFHMEIIYNIVWYNLKMQVDLRHF